MLSEKEIRNKIANIQQYKKYPTQREFYIGYEKALKDVLEIV